jgi:predicted outer membrane protein
MQRLWMGAAGLLLLAACRSDGERGQVLGTEKQPGELGARPGIAQGPEGRGVEVVDLSTPRILAVVHQITQSEIDAAKLAEQRATTPEVKEYATRVVNDYQQDLDAMGRTLKGKNIDLQVPAIQGDPILKAQHAMSDDATRRLRGLSGPAFEAAYLNAQPASQLLLVQLAQQGQQATKDPEIAGALRTLAQQGQDRAARARGLVPKACGGEH